jgi:hypothetical protein
MVGSMFSSGYISRVQQNFRCRGLGGNVLLKYALAVYCVID